MDKTKVALLCPVAESVNPQVFKHALAMVSYASAHGYEINQVGVTERTLIHNARNQLATGFKSTDCEWAFWMDSDMVFPPSTIVHLIEKAKELGTKFITGVYYQRLNQHLPVLWRKSPVRTDGKNIPEFPAQKDGREAYLHHFVIPPEKIPIKADICGFGAVAMHREMLEKIPYPYFKTISDDCSEDFYFCLKAKEAGYQLWADPSLEIGHMANPVFVTRKDMQLDEKAKIEIEK